MSIETAITEAIKTSKFIRITVGTDGLSGHINGTYNGVQPHFKLQWEMGSELSVIFYAEGKWVGSTYLNIPSFYKDGKFSRRVFEEKIRNRAGQFFRF